MSHDAYQSYQTVHLHAQTAQASIAEGWGGPQTIGGAVNLISKSAFDSSPERRIRGSIGGIWRATDPRDPAFKPTLAALHGLPHARHLRRCGHGRLDLRGARRHRGPPGWALASAG